MISKLVFFLEEPSAKEMLDGLMPRLMPDGLYHQCVVFEGKSDLEKKLVRRLRGWLEPNVFFVVLRDQDGGDCHKIKQRLIGICKEGREEDALIRIACRELESWYLADLQAVEVALKINGLSKMQDKKKFRNPDLLPGPSRILEDITKGRYQKVSGSRAIGPLLEISNTRSNSFKVFISGIQTVFSG